VARSGEILTVFIASSLALIVVSGIGSFGGQALLKVLPLARIRQGGGILLLGFGIYTFVTLLTS
jgi:putative Ca2+/H+ antiporter (TMEM165/GDT1 family)